MAPLIIFAYYVEGSQATSLSRGLRLHEPHATRDGTRGYYSNDLLPPPRCMIVLTIDNFLSGRGHSEGSAVCSADEAEKDSAMTPVMESVKCFFGGFSRL